MSVFNSQVLLLCIFMCISISSKATFNVADTVKVKENKKELIIVNIDQSLASSMEGLVDYVSQIYASNSKGFISIKRYLPEDDTKSKEVIAELIVLLIDAGISDASILVSDEELNLSNPYFTLAVSDRPEVQ